MAKTKQDVEKLTTRERFQKLTVELNEWVLEHELTAREFTNVADEIRLWNDWDFDGDIPEHLKE